MKLLEIAIFWFVEVLDGLLPYFLQGKTSDSMIKQGMELPTVEFWNAIYKGKLTKCREIDLSVK